MAVFSLFLYASIGLALIDGAPEFKKATVYFQTTLLRNANLSCKADASIHIDQIFVGNYIGVVSPTTALCFFHAINSSSNYYNHIISKCNDRRWCKLSSSDVRNQTFTRGFPSCDHAFQNRNSVKVVYRCQVSGSTLSTSTEKFHTTSATNGIGGDGSGMSGANLGVVLAAVFGALTVLIVLAVLVFLAIRRRRRNRPASAVDLPSTDNSTNEFSYYSAPSHTRPPGDVAHDYSHVSVGDRKSSAVDNYYALPNHTIAEHKVENVYSSVNDLPERLRSNSVTDNFYHELEPPPPTISIDDQRDGDQRVEFIPNDFYDSPSPADLDSNRLI